MDRIRASAMLKKGSFQRPPGSIQIGMVGPFSSWAAMLVQPRKLSSLPRMSNVLTKRMSDSPELASIG